MDYISEIKKALVKKGINANISLTTNFKQIGLDSLDAMDLIVQLEEKNNFRIDDSQLDKIKTVADLITAIEKSKKI